jgi:hypothetical protein
VVLEEVKKMKNTVCCWLLVFCAVGVAQAGDPVAGKQKAVHGG